uniref:Reverse transcriptase zinc-binding domain-containing protein n=1 Tax=Tanacetum cinerariifolium TaxID=118510 RepID=A0A699H0M9_TANCI|nr:hypothetical protein [Tanacetum cinerariifolium]
MYEKLRRGWRKILQVRPLIRQFIWHRLGDGNVASVWFDRWCALIPLASLISNRDINRAGFHLSSKVVDVLDSDSWNWPIEWQDKYPMACSLTIPNLDPSSRDLLVWRNQNDVEMQFSVATVWDTIRPRGEEVDWYNVVWFSHCVLRHAFHLWILMNIYFLLYFSSEIWAHMKMFAGLPKCSSSLEDIVICLVPISKKRSARSVIAKLVFAACSYFTWQERNYRLFKKRKRSKEQVLELIMSSIRLKLLSCRFKKTSRVDSIVFAIVVDESFMVAHFIDVGDFGIDLFLPLVLPGPNIDSIFGYSMSNIPDCKSEFINVNQTLISDIRPAQTFPEPILYLAGLASSREHALNNPSILINGEEMAFLGHLKVAVDNDVLEIYFVSKNKDVPGFELAVVDEGFSGVRRGPLRGVVSLLSILLPLKLVAWILNCVVIPLYAAHNTLYNLHYPLLNEKLGFLTFDDLVNVYDVHALQMALVGNMLTNESRIISYDHTKIKDNFVSLKSRNNLLEHEISKLEDNLSKARKNKILSKETFSKLKGLKPHAEKVVDLSLKLKAADLEKIELVKDLLPLAVKRLFESEHFNHALGDLQQKAITFGRSQELDEVHGEAEWGFFITPFSDGSVGPEDLRSLSTHPLCFLPSLFSNLLAISLFVTSVNLLAWGWAYASQPRGEEGSFVEDFMDDSIVRGFYSNFLANFLSAGRMPLTRTELMHSFEAARYTIRPSSDFGATRVGSFYMYFFISSKALSASLVHVKSFFSKHPFSVLKNGKDFSALLDRNLLRAASLPFKLCTSLIVLGFHVSSDLAFEDFVHQPLPLYASRKHLSLKSKSESTFQSISSSEYQSFGQDLLISSTSLDTALLRLMAILLFFCCTGVIFLFAFNLCSVTKTSLPILSVQEIPVILKYSHANMSALLLNMMNLEPTFDLYRTAKCIFEGIIPSSAIAVMPKSMFWGESDRTIRNVICSLLWCGSSPTVIRRIIFLKGLTCSSENPDNVV